MGERNFQYIVFAAIFFLGNQFFLWINQLCGYIIWLLTPSDWIKCPWNKKTSFSLFTVRMHVYDGEMEKCFPQTIRDQSRIPSLTWVWNYISFLRGTQKKSRNKYYKCGTNHLFCSQHEYTSTPAGTVFSAYAALIWKMPISHCSRMDDDVWD